MQEFRCANCGKLLAKVEGKVEIKCPRCKEINIRELSIKDRREILENLNKTVEHCREIFNT